MRDDYIREIPQWYNENNRKDLVLSNDIDSLLSCAILHKMHPKWGINYFYDFEHLYKSEFAFLFDDEEKIWVDVAVQTNEKAFDNHVSVISSRDTKNNLIINPNALYDITNNVRYKEKYAGSTALMIWSLYGLPLPKTEKGKMALIAIDSGYKGFYNKDFYKSNYRYMADMFGYKELVDLIESKTEQDFNDIEKELGLKEHILVKYHSLKPQYKTLTTEIKYKELSELLDIDIVLPTEVFTSIEDYEMYDKKIDSSISKKNDVHNEIFSCAFTYKNRMRYSVKVG